ncbi:MAG: bifunctional riboflavin kinase/FAD synthetase [Streptococcus sp.]|nr:bifunctional riboflavin kinase/FAD synthetase [Streptococcus sp.]
METIKIKNENDIQQTEDTVLVLGYFDGLHKGHQALFSAARQIAKDKQLKIAVLTFPESPKLAFVKYKPSLMNYLMSPDDREKQLASLGVDFLYLIEFTSSFSQNTAKEFFEKYVSRLKAEVIVAGFDYHFGADKREAEYLSTFFDGEVMIVPSVNLDGEKISSTRIRKEIQKGQIVTTNQLLGYPFSTRGLVVHGDARGQTIGYPTANFVSLDRVILPADGVYVVNVEYENKLYRGMASVGKNITFDGEELRLEVNIFDFSKDIYGETIRVLWLERIRDMVKFNGIEQLIEQLKSDEQVARAW